MKLSRLYLIHPQHMLIDYEQICNIISKIKLATGVLSTLLIGDMCEWWSGNGGTGFAAAVCWFFLATIGHYNAITVGDINLFNRQTMHYSWSLCFDSICNDLMSCFRIRKSCNSINQHPVCRLVLHLLLFRANYQFADLRIFLRWPCWIVSLLFVYHMCGIHVKK